MAGLYSVTTNNANGVTFSASGVFSGTGAQTITLTSTNTPTAAGPFTYTPSGGGCAFDVTYTSGPPPPTSFLKCTVSGLVTNFNSGLLAVGDMAAGQLSISGNNSDGGSGDIQLSLINMSGPLTNGNYNNISAFNTNKGCLFVYNSGAYISSVSNANSFLVTLTSITATTAIGTFSGTIYDNSGAGPGTKSIAAGSFSITY